MVLWVPVSEHHLNKKYFCQNIDIQNDAFVYSGQSSRLPRAFLSLQNSNNFTAIQCIHIGRKYRKRKIGDPKNNVENQSKRMLPVLNF